MHAATGTNPVLFFAMGSAPGSSAHMTSMTTLTTPTDEEMLHFQACAATALQKVPYFSTLTFSLRPAATEAVDIFAVDPGRRIYMNFKKCIAKGVAFCAQGILHEGGHLLGDHARLAELGGFGDHERKSCNLAGAVAEPRPPRRRLLVNHGVFAAMICDPGYQTPIHYPEKLRAKQDQARKKKQDQQNAQRQPQDGAGNEPGNGSQPGHGSRPQKGCGSSAVCVMGDFGLDLDDETGRQACPASTIEKELVRISTAAAIRDHQRQHGIGPVPYVHRDRRRMNGTLRSAGRHTIVLAAHQAGTDHPLLRRHLCLPQQPRPGPAASRPVFRLVHEM